ncbi:MAG: DUF5706 domain-containing protein [Flavobacteriales bacterium]|nr:DUF5706 domain-containing protein [Flavobacteriales bacterium]MCW8912678.1 DUF5706 domain-containing protein [Flavobacteriales bacterium]MCW8938283.1 DUF5706 domain-containing protein [Flavobacteriales bacterium]MCW8967378.1 DUF5706 domain-containing protein [Flavobacteriales bacterium]MCW8990987.1 DUF5706 domain-containing protein [Flavobacteriales bacterium]
MTKTNFLFENFKNIQDLIKFADQKAGAILVICGIILTVFMGFAKPLYIVNIDNLAKCDNLTISILVFILGLVLAILLVVIFGICIFKILKPKFAKNYSEGSSSMFYFEHIAKLTKSEFKERTKSISKKSIKKDLSEQIYEVSKILMQKNKYCAITMNLLFVAVIDLLLFVFFSNQL